MTNDVDRKEDPTHGGAQRCVGDQLGRLGPPRALPARDLCHGGVVAVAAAVARDFPRDGGVAASDRGRDLPAGEPAGQTPRDLLTHGHSRSLRSFSTRLIAHNNPFGRSVGRHPDTDRQRHHHHGTKRRCLGQRE